MKARLPVILIGTHLLALGAGWWCLRPSGDSEPGADRELQRTSKSGRSVRQERRVSTEDLLAAYRLDSDLWSQAAAKRRSEAPPVEQTFANASSATADLPVEQRAAAIADIAGAMQKEVDATDSGKVYDHQLVQALVARWMKEDPAACAVWIGQMRMRTGWRDPFSTFAKALPAQEVLKLMDQGWLQRNREMGLRSLAAQLGEVSAGEVPAVLSALSSDEAKFFLDEAVGRARVEDVAVWLELLSGDSKRLELLAYQWIGESRPNWEEKAQLAMAAAEGTPAEEAFRKRWEERKMQSGKDRELARLASEPAEVNAALIDLYLEAGHDEAEASQLATQDILSDHTKLEAWQRAAWYQDLQHCVLGQRELAETLTARLAAIETEIPEALQAATLTSAWGDAMVIDPVATLEVARKSGRTDEVLQSAKRVMGGVGISIAARAEVLLALSEQGLWQLDGKLLPTPAAFSAEYLRDDPEAARLWIARLPSPLSQAVKEETR
jgi:hypothetical protein